jgi:hypothetical protein
MCCHAGLLVKKHTVIRRNRATAFKAVFGGISRVALYREWGKLKLVKLSLYKSAEAFGDPGD